MSKELKQKAIQKYKEHLKDPNYYENSEEESYYTGFIDGYNKANEWHDIKEIEPSKEQLGKQLLIKMESVTGNTDYAYIVYKYNGESMSDVIGVLAWKEIVLPKENG